MNKAKIFSLIFLFTFGLVGCYTIVSHPIVKKDNSYHRVKFYNDCLSCHSQSELIDYGHVYVDRPSSMVILEPEPLWFTPIYVPPWWWDIRIPVVEETSQRPNDRTRLRDLDGGRTSAPTDFSIPSRNPGSSSSSSNNSNSSTGNSTNSSNEQKSRDRDSNTSKSRDNSGERKK